MQQTENSPLTDCENKICILHQFCTQNKIEDFEEERTISTYRKGQKIIRAGEKIEGIHCLRKGKVKIALPGFNNREQIIRFINADQNILGYFGGTEDTYSYHAVCLEDSVVCHFPKKMIQLSMIFNHKFAIELLNDMAETLRRTEIRMKNLAQMTVREKIIEALLYISDSFGKNETDMSLNVQLSRDEIASIAGTNAEQVSRFFSEFKREGLINASGKRISIINEKEMRERVKCYGFL